MSQNIILVDESNQTRQILSKFFNDHNCQCEIIDDALSAIDIAIELQPEYLLISSNISGIQLVDFCKMLVKYNPDNTTIVILNYNPENNLDQIKTIGNISIIAAPFTETSIPDLLGEFFPEQNKTGPLVDTEEEPDLEDPFNNEAEGEAYEYEDEDDDDEDIATMLGWQGTGPRQQAQENQAEPLDDIENHKAEPEYTTGDLLDKEASCDDATIDDTINIDYGIEADSLEKDDIDEIVYELDEDNEDNTLDDQYGSNSILSNEDIEPDIEPVCEQQDLPDTGELIQEKTEAIYSDLDENIDTDTTDSNHQDIHTQTDIDSDSVEQCTIEETAIVEPDQNIKPETDPMDEPATMVSSTKTKVEDIDGGEISEKQAVSDYNYLYQSMEIEEGHTPQELLFGWNDNKHDSHESIQSTSESTSEITSEIMDKVADAVIERVADETALPEEGIEDRKLNETMEKTIRETIERVAPGIIEKIVWEIVPDLAENLIKSEIERLDKEVDDDISKRITQVK